MSKKKTLKSQKSKPDTAEQLRESAHQIWLAGLGAFAKAQQEGAKVFETLVDQGQSLESSARKQAREAEAVARKTVSDSAAGIRQQAETTWDRLEQVFEDRVGRALQTLGVPTADEIKELSKRIDKLAEEVKKATK